MRRIGLTGGIACGKSTVSAMFKQLGAAVVDADRLAREVVEPGQAALLEIGERFPDAIGSDGTLDRAKLAKRVFSDPPSRRALDAIMLPKIHARYRQQSEALERAGTRVMIYDAPLLFEAGADEQMDGTIVVTASKEVQIARLIARTGLSEAEARSRLLAQMPVADKAARATWTIDNSKDLESTRRQVEAIWKDLA